MELVNIEIKVPKEMKQYIITKDDSAEIKRNALMLYPYIQDKTIFYGKAAEILGIHKIEIIELYESMGLPYFNMDISDVEEDLETFHSLRGVCIWL